MTHLEPELFPLPVGEVQLSVTRRGKGSYELRVLAREEGRGWDGRTADSYLGLSLDELGDVLFVVLEDLFRGVQAT